MLSPNQRADLDEIIVHFGNETQMVKAVEELGECIVAITRYLALPKCTPGLFDHVVEETADALIMLHQIRQIVGADEVDDVVSYKIGRTIDRIKSEKAYGKT